MQLDYRLVLSTFILEQSLSRCLFSFAHRSPSSLLAVPCCLPMVFLDHRRSLLSNAVQA